MKTTLKFLSYIFLGIGLVAIGCSKDGDPGSDGLQGEQGIQGEPGQDGEDGVDGKDGNANVVASDWFQPTESDFTSSSDSHKTLPLPLSNYNVNEDVLLVYYYDQYENNSSYSHVYHIPYYRYHIDGQTIDKSITIDIRPTFYKMYVKITSYSRNLSPREYLWEPDALNPENKGVRFRYVIIPSNTATGKNASSPSIKNSFEYTKKELSNNGIDINDYYAVCDYYGIAY
ncbi:MULTISPECIES: collagen-like protein [unclassified Zobellia]|uniref:collagen-like protein n=1 Tax=unclassified Zobellia TaxID=2620635 RepID=UPI001C067FCE|nr:MULTISPECIES: collagen-like protein [unclassified Zobellia]MBU2975619.1 collagen-like protein [Zobellia sp. B3R18]MDO6821272.1 collagen-like protein [Zobellia sp. 1_MG-2023]